MDYSIKIGGEAGQGIQTIGGTLAILFAKSGYNVFTNQDYESRIRGGHNFYQVRLSDKPISASSDTIDILVALDKESIKYHAQELTENGYIIYDSSALKEKHEAPYFLDIPFVSLAIEHGGNRIMANSVAIGSVLGMLGENLDILSNIFDEIFGKKGDEIIKGNINAANAGHDYAVAHCERCKAFSTGDSDVAMQPKMLIAGNDAIGLGAVASGLKFYSAYPMTPSTGIMNYIAGKEAEYGIIVEQAEDEISAINMALGASFAGVRAMTGSSGGGFALMVEGLSLAGMTETPIVVALAQRPGPATGFPTRTEQGDLLFAIYSGHGEFPRVIFAPGTPEQAFILTNKAFEISEKYQVPVIIITDQYLADSEWTFDRFDLNKVSYSDQRLRGNVLQDSKEYNRHTFTESGVSAMGVPGDSTHLVVTDSDEHDESGHMVEDAGTRDKMVDKRLFKKLPGIREEISPPVIYGDEKPDIVFVCWGSNYGILKEVVNLLSGDNKIAMMHFSEIYPLPDTAKINYLEILRNASLTFCIENNATGQFARLIRAETGFEFKVKINQYDGRPFKVNSLLEELNAHITGL
jgi:2-oxoglutarate ferredoxin oxidoreductase subunit alpha